MPHANCPVILHPPVMGHTRTHARTHSCTHARIHAFMHARTHTRTHSCMHARTRTRRRGWARIHTHTYKTKTKNLLHVIVASSHEFAQRPAHVHLRTRIMCVCYGALLNIRSYIILRDTMEVCVYTYSIALHSILYCVSTYSIVSYYGGAPQYFL